MRKKDEQASLGDERAIREHPCCADDLSGESLWVKKKSLGTNILKVLRTRGKNRKNDLERYPETDTLIVGTPNSLILGRGGYPLNSKILSLIKRDQKLIKKEITENAILGLMYNRALNKYVASSYPQHAEVEISQSDIEFFSKIVNGTKGQGRNSKKFHRHTPFGGG